MSQSQAISGLPTSSRRSLEKLGADLKVARQRRKWSLREAAGRLLTTVPTLRRLEAGAEGVGIGILAHALFLYGMEDRLGWLADPRFDFKALTDERRRHLKKERATEFDV